MAYLEIKERNGKVYFYRTLSVRNVNKIGKKRVYLGLNLSKEEIEEKSIEADKKLLKSKINRNLEKIKPIVLIVLKKYKIKKASIFGSYARGEENKNSDIDILVEPREGMGLEFVGMALELEDKLGRKVDLVTYKSISHYLRKYILEDEVRIL